MLCQAALSPAPPGQTLPPVPAGMRESGYGVFSYDGTVDLDTGQPRGWSFALARFPANLSEWGGIMAISPDGCLAVHGTADHTTATSEEMIVLVPCEFQAQAGQIDRGFDPPLGEFQREGLQRGFSGHSC